MKKTILVSAIILISYFVQGQKPPDIKKDTVYYLLGTMADFQLLIKNIVRPTSVSEDDKNALIKWIQSIKVLPENKEADKPKNK